MLWVEVCYNYFSDEQPKDIAPTSKKIFVLRQQDLVTNDVTLIEVGVYYNDQLHNF